MELVENWNLFDKFDFYNEQSIKVSRWYWLLPPLKLYLENTMVWKFWKSLWIMNKNTALWWVLVIKLLLYFLFLYGGWFKAISSISEVLENNYVSCFFWSFIILVLIATVSGCFSATYRLSQWRQHKILKKFQQY